MRSNINPILVIKKCFIRIKNVLVVFLIWTVWKSVSSLTSKTLSALCTCHLCSVSLIIRVIVLRLVYTELLQTTQRFLQLSAITTLPVKFKKTHERTESLHDMFRAAAGASLFFWSVSNSRLDSCNDQFLIFTTNKSFFSLCSTDGLCCVLPL